MSIINSCIWCYGNLFGDNINYFGNNDVRVGISKIFKLSRRMYDIHHLDIYLWCLYNISKLTRKKYIHYTILCVIMPFFNFVERSSHLNMKYNFYNIIEVLLRAHSEDEKNNVIINKIKSSDVITKIVRDMVHPMLGVRNICLSIISSIISSTELSISYKKYIFTIMHLRLQLENSVLAPMNIKFYGMIISNIIAEDEDEVIEFLMKTSLVSFLF